MNYNWDLDKLKKDTFLYSVIKDHDDEVQGIIPKEKPLKTYQRLLENFYYLNQCKFLIPYCDETNEFFVKKMKGNPEIPRYESPKFSFDDSMTITHDFYNEVLKYKPSLLKTFNKHFNESYRLIKFRNLTKYSTTDGETFYSSKLKEAYISIAKSKPLNELLTLAHEYGHAIAMMHFDFADNCQPLGECESTFMEFLLLDYMQNKNIYKKACKNYKKSTIYEYVTNMIGLEYNFDYLQGINDYFIDYQTYDFDKRKLVNIISDYTGAEISEIINNSKFDVGGNVFYLIADMFAFDFVNIYRQDPEKAIDLYYKVIRLASKEEYEVEKCFNKVKKLGLNPANSFLRF